MKNNPLVEQLATRLQSFIRLQADAGVPSPHLLLALSGGLDSLALLHALHACIDTQPFQLSAMHVHHGLSPAADGWLQHCAEQCQRLSVPFYSARVSVAVAAGIGVEAAARDARYQALRAMRSQLGAHAIVTAHHVQDQAETLLLQLLRGAGVKGLSAMPSWDARTYKWRPWLATSRDDIYQFAQGLSLQWVEDESNAQQRFDRNFLRHAVLPSIRQRYPQFEQSLARSASHLAEAQQLLDQLAALDLLGCDQQATWCGQSLDMQALQMLGETRGKNLLRAWIHQQCLLAPSALQLQTYWQQLVAVKPDRYLHLPLYASAGKPAAFLHHYQQRLYCVKPPAALPTQPMIWHGEASQVWGDWQVDFKLAKGQGISLQKLGVSPAAITLFKRYQTPFKLPEQVQLLLHARAGGESLQPDQHRPSRALKVIFQMLSMPPWQRAYQALASVQQGQSAPQLVGLLPHTIDHRWHAGRNAYGLLIFLTPRV